MRAGSAGAGESEVACAKSGEGAKRIKRLRQVFYKATGAIQDKLLGHDFEKTFKHLKESMSPEDYHRVLSLFRKGITERLQTHAQTDFEEGLCSTYRVEERFGEVEQRIAELETEPTAPPPAEQAGDDASSELAFEDALRSRRMEEKDKEKGELKRLLELELEQFKQDEAVLAGVNAKLRRIHDTVTQAAHDDQNAMDIFGDSQPSPRTSAD